MLFVGSVFAIRMEETSGSPHCNHPPGSDWGQPFHLLIHSWAWKGVALLRSASRLRRTGSGLFLITKTSSLTWTMSYFPFKLSGTSSEKISHLLTLTLAGSHSCGGACEVSTSKPSNLADAGICLERSASQTLRKD